MATTEERLLYWTRVVAAKRGLGLTIDEVAERCGVNRRTVFRLFESRTVLLDRAFQSALSDYDKHIPRVLNGSESPDEWLERSLTIVHRMNLNVGKLWWDLATLQNQGKDGDIAAIYDPAECNAIIERYTINAWFIFGGYGAAPSCVSSLFYGLTSVFYTHLMVNDIGLNIVRLAECNARALKSSMARP